MSFLMTFLSRLSPDFIRSLGGTGCGGFGSGGGDGCCGLCCCCC